MWGQTERRDPDFAEKVVYPGMFHCTSALVLTSFCNAERIPLKTKRSKKKKKLIKCGCTERFVEIDSHFEQDGGAAISLYCSNINTVSVLLSIYLYDPDLKIQLDMFRKSDSGNHQLLLPYEMNGCKGFMIESGWIADSWLLWCSEWAAALSAGSVSSSRPVSRAAA